MLRRTTLSLLVFLLAPMLAAGTVYNSQTRGVDTTNASNITSGTLGAARGGAGTINGALKGNGAGAVSQASCADLSNGAASCSVDTTNATNIASGNLANARLSSPWKVCTGTGPSFSAGAGAGSTPTIAFASGAGNCDGQISVTAGSLPTASAIVLTITFGAAFGGNAFCTITPATLAAQLLNATNAVAILSAPGTSSFTINSGSVGLVQSSVYKWNYHCGAAS